MEEEEEIEETVTKKKKSSKHKTARGRTTRYSCLYSTVPNKRRAPPRV